MEEKEEQLSSTSCITNSNQLSLTNMTLNTNRTGESTSNVVCTHYNDTSTSHKQISLPRQAPHKSLELCKPSTPHHLPNKTSLLSSLSTHAAFDRSTDQGCSSSDRSILSHTTCHLYNMPSSKNCDVDALQHVTVINKRNEFNETRPRSVQQSEKLLQLSQQEQQHYNEEENSDLIHKCENIYNCDDVYVCNNTSIHKKDKYESNIYMDDIDEEEEEDYAMYIVANVTFREMCLRHVLQIWRERLQHKRNKEYTNEIKAEYVYSCTLIRVFFDAWRWSCKEHTTQRTNLQKAREEHMHNYALRVLRAWHTRVSVHKAQLITIHKWDEEQRVALCCVMYNKWMRYYAIKRNVSNLAAHHKKCILSKYMQQWQLWHITQARRNMYCHVLRLHNYDRWAMECISSKQQRHSVMYWSKDTTTDVSNAVLHDGNVNSQKNIRLNSSAELTTHIQYTLREFAMRSIWMKWLKYTLQNKWLRLRQHNDNVNHLQEQICHHARECYWQKWVEYTIINVQQKQLQKQIVYNYYNKWQMYTSNMMQSTRELHKHLSKCKTNCWQHWKQRTERKQLTYTQNSNADEFYNNVMASHYLHFAFLQWHKRYQARCYASQLHHVTHDMRHDLLRHVALHRLVNNVLFSNTKSRDQDEHITASDDDDHENRRLYYNRVNNNDNKDAMKRMINEELCGDTQKKYMRKDNVQAHCNIQGPADTTKYYHHQLHSFLDPIPLTVPHSERVIYIEDITSKLESDKDNDNNVNIRELESYEKSRTMENNFKSTHCTKKNNSCNSESCASPSSRIIVHKIRCIDVAVQTDDADKLISDKSSNWNCNSTESHKEKMEGSTSTDDLCNINAVNAKHLRKRKTAHHNKHTCKDGLTQQEECEESKTKSWELEESEQSEKECEFDDDTRSDHDDDNSEEFTHSQEQRKQKGNVQQLKRKHIKLSKNDDCLLDKKKHEEEEEEECELCVSNNKHAKHKAKCNCATCHENFISLCHSIHENEEEDKDEEYEKYNELISDAKVRWQWEVEFEALSLDELQHLGTSLLAEYNELMSCAEIREAELAMVERKWHHHYCELFRQQQHCFNKEKRKDKHDQSKSRNTSIGLCSLHKKHRCTNNLHYCKNSDRNHRNHRCYCNCKYTNKFIDCTSYDDICSLSLQSRYVQLLQERVKRQTLRCKLTVFTQVLRRRIGSV